MRILFITATRIGDAVLSTGLLDHLARVYPQARFTVACGPVAVGVFARMPRRERTIVVDKRRFDSHWVELWLRTVGTYWDLVVDLRGSALSFVLPARRRVVMRGGAGQGIVWAISRVRLEWSRHLARWSGRMPRIGRGRRLCCRLERR